jgi:RNA recognition motif-containing protein
MTDRRKTLMNIYVGNISRESTENEVRELFEEHGTVNSVSLIKDKFTSQLKGFGFVEMPNSEEAKKAIKELDGQSFGGRPLTVNEAKPRTERRDARPRFSRSY